MRKEVNEAAWLKDKKKKNESRRKLKRRICIKVE